MRNIRWWLWLLLAAAILFLALTIKYKWQIFEDTFVNLAALNLFVQLGIFLVLLWRLPRFRRWIRDSIGEGTPIQRPRYRFILPTLFFMPFALYTLVSGAGKTVTAGDVSLIVIAPTLGGLMFVAAGSRRIRRRARIELISVAQKLIAATVLLIVFAPLLFTIDLLGGINLNSVEWSCLNVFRWACFWGSAWAFYPGVYLFLLGISDLVFALRHLRR